MADDLGSIPGTNNPVPAFAAAPSYDYRLGRARKLALRYQNGFQTSETLVSLGGVIKIIGWVLGGIAALVAVIGFIVAVANSNPGSGLGIAVAALIYGVIIVFGAYVYGSMIAGIGHGVQATQDTAVNNSPFLTDDERASILSLD
jgi:hypothetical protein